MVASCLAGTIGLVGLSTCWPVNDSQPAKGTGFNLVLFGFAGTEVQLNNYHHVVSARMTSLRSATRMYGSGVLESLDVCRTSQTQHNPWPFKERGEGNLTSSSHGDEVQDLDIEKHLYIVIK